MRMGGEEGVEKVPQMEQAEVTIVPSDTRNGTNETNVRSFTGQSVCYTDSTHGWVNGGGELMTTMVYNGGFTPTYLTPPYTAGTNGMMYQQEPMPVTYPPYQPPWGSAYESSPSTLPHHYLPPCAGTPTPLQHPHPRRGGRYDHHGAFLGPCAQPVPLRPYRG